MPNKKVDGFKLESQAIKRSAKLLPCQKEMMVFWANRGMSQRKIAAMFHVSRRTVQFTIDPAKKVRNLEARHERGGSSIYYNKEKHREAVKSLRNYKKGLIETFKSETK